MNNRYQRFTPRLLLLAAIMAPIAPGTTLFYSGNFVHDDDLVTIDFLIAAAGPVSITTTSFASGGFAPVLSVFDSIGNLVAEDYNGSGGHTCSGSDPVSGKCWDATLSGLSLTAGSYKIALTEDDNLPNGPTFADGFLESGNGDFTGAPPFSNSGKAFTASFYPDTGGLRTSAWAFQVTGALSAVPEPGTTGLAGAALGALAFFANKLRKLTP